MTEKTFDEIEDEMRNLESNPEVSKRQLRLFMQELMSCGHAVGNLLTCDAPPFGCLICNQEHKNCLDKQKVRDVLEVILKGMWNNSLTLNGAREKLKELGL